MSQRSPTASELVASVVYFDRYAAYDGDVVDFWRTLSPAEQEHAVHLVRAVMDAHIRHDPTAPTCPKGCDVATTPEYVAPGRFVCSACGTEFAWPPDTDADEPPPHAFGCPALACGRCGSTVAGYRERPAMQHPGPDGNTNRRHAWIYQLCTCGRDDVVYAAGERLGTTY